MKHELEKIKIVRIIARLNIGGPAIQAVMLTECLNQGEFTSYLISGRIGEKEGDMLPYALERNVSPIIFPEFGRKISSINDFMTFVKLVRFLRKIRPHIVHTHTAKAGTLGRLAAWVARVPIKIHTFHGHVFSGYFGRSKTTIFIFIERVLAFLTDRILVLSTHQYDELVDIYRVAPCEKFQIVPLGFDLDPFFALSTSVNETRQAQINPSPLVIGYISRLVDIKNPFLALASFGNLYRQLMIPLQLWISGGGPLELSLQRAAEKSEWGVDVRFLGWQYNMAQLYSSLDIIILTSLNEGTPVVLIEAMASGKTFVATKVGGVPDLMVGEGEEVCGKNGGRFTIYDNGILVETQDIQGMVDGLAFLVSNPERRAMMGRIGQEFVKTKFTKDRLLKDIQNLYRELLNHKGICSLPPHFSKNVSPNNCQLEQ